MPYADPEARRRNSREYHARNAEARRARIKAWREKNPENVAANQHRYYLRHREEILEGRRKTRDESRLERERELARLRREADPEGVAARAREAAARRRARIRGLTVEPVDPQAIFVRDQGLCGICGDLVDPADWHLDHVVPIARNGPHCPSNVQVSHPLCNRRKAASLWPS